MSYFTPGHCNSEALLPETFRIFSWSQYQKRLVLTLLKPPI